MLEGPLGLLIVGAIGVCIALVAGYFSAAGLRSMLTLQYWAVVLGAITPGLLFLLWSFTRREKIDHFSLLLGFVVLVILTDFIVGMTAGFFFRSISSWQMRALLGVGLGVLSMFWVLWTK